MPRRNTDRRTRRSPAPAAPLSAGLGRTETGPDGEPWNVRTISGAQAVKAYRCPGCDHEVAPGVPHVVAWPGEDRGGAEERRHWHTGCWTGRRTRGLTRRWS